MIHPASPAIGRMTWSLNSGTGTVCSLAEADRSGLRVLPIWLFQLRSAHLFDAHERISNLPGR